MMVSTASSEMATGTVTRAMPRALYAIRCEDGRCVLATLGETMRRVIVGLRPGDRVQVEISPRDPARGRVTAKM